MIEPLITGALAGIASGRVFNATAPANAQRPYAIFQKVGGQDASSLDGLAERMNARVQFVVWANTAKEAATVMRQVMVSLCGDELKGVPVGAPVGLHEPDTDWYGERLDISFWFTP
ncbi:DUF3168 domain-containing protein [Pandoraea bronchicola]|uniref:DUF3168 domain-containing protein n=1 Tax=Pandoraea bronchicola TaxID=2508287 RepID=A0A5E5BZ65_9BURK|nr:DUF3168 domain-containing protein [Pandoraea bronchicola]VVE90402.1 hypothetical protein PBR20603_04386 [Pandoraea bronchicola]